jgi:hypothetical protein
MMRKGRFDFSGAGKIDRKELDHGVYENRQFSAHSSGEIALD